MRDTPGSLMLFAAGFGTRMRPLTDDRPKPMVEVAGRPLIDHALDQTAQIAPDRIVVNLHYKPEPLLKHLAGTGVQTLLETPDILDTGGGLRNALPRLGTAPVFTLNTDAIWIGPSPIAMLQEAWRPEVMDALLVCVPLRNTHSHGGQGDFEIDPQCRLMRGRAHVYGGAQIIKTDRLDEIAEEKFSLNRLWDLMLAEGRIYGLEYPGHWCDVGQPDSINVAENLLAGQDV
ncbi:nucleotidyltransferase family protein [uncultured Roseobacter sp.]|uniref:nucleotidyltransferase family protein n=1 Tax=uncultured Roseobacter sp. TaxID=114847 RepID=UPI00262A7E70|nr:nucleotidyltransferase family protein [uncultured Roseobacter sp.]